ncbi:MAG TPA: hypothetical protein PLQ97_05175 [Myxococcota bacterium]|nr:hypothetical protein [Myxococcota bacterium]HQK51638.1 hypothetical protein [Myxococcota bacterium]
MRGTCLLVALCLLPAPTLSRPAPPRECEALPLPASSEVREYLETRPYRSGLTDLVQGREAEALRSLEAAWQQVRRWLQPFTDRTCRDQALREALRQVVFTTPPLAIPGEDRFRPPPLITRAIGTLRCRAGDLPGAALWLLEHGDPTDMTLRAVTRSWLEAAGFPEAARALSGEPGR